MIPFNKACRWGNEITYLIDAVARGHISGDGLYTKKCHEFLEQTLGVRKALLTTSGTHALEMAALLLNVGPGDEVLFPSYTFVSTVNAFVLRGIRPVFVDVRRETLNIDHRVLESRITPRTKAIVPVHYAGVGCEMDGILDVASRHGLTVIEDNAHGLFGRYRGRYLGSIGQMAIQSFHETKNFTCGEGGALLINDTTYSARAEIIREKGTDRSLFFRGLVDKYGWVDVGSSYLPSDMLSAFLLAQLEARDRVQARRREIWEYYQRNLQEWADDNGVKLPFVPEHCDNSYHMFYLIMPSLERRQELLAHLKAVGIHAVFHYLPLHLSTMGQRFGGSPGDCPVTEEISDCLLRLPFYCDLTPDDLAFVVREVRKFVC
jgi:dTDP-4-amino-4,6-dideoxygalactose transaminase